MVIVIGLSVNVIALSVIANRDTFTKLIFSNYEQYARILHSAPNYFMDMVGSGW